MRKLFQECKLVHADLSEYNMLYNNGEIWVIDVSQSVEHDHPLALEFLRRDVVNVNEYFEKHNAHNLNTKFAFDFITSHFENIDLNIELDSCFDH